MQNKRDNVNDNKDEQTQMTSGNYTSKPHALWNPLLPKKLDIMQSTFGENKRINHIIFHAFCKTIQVVGWSNQNYIWWQENDDAQTSLDLTIWKKKWCFT